jgi:hypothetical protein
MSIARSRTVERENEPGLFSQMDELVGKEQARQGIAPADESFGSSNSVIQHLGSKHWSPAAVPAPAL